MVPIPLVYGDLVALGTLDASMLPLLERWENDPLTAELGGEAFAPVASGRVAVGWAPLLAGERAAWAGFSILALPDLRPLGYLNLRDFGTPHRSAEFGITIGDPSDRGRGYGTDATRLALRYAFEVLGAHNVWLDTFSANPAAIRAYEKAGFREIGRIREARRLGGMVADVVLMDCLPGDLR